MIVSAVEDILRLKFGQPDMDPVLLKMIRDMARSEIESKGNFYWQAAHEDITIPVGDSEFNVRTDFVVPDFFDFRFLALQRGTVGSKSWRFIFPGSWQATLEGVLVLGEGFPERCTFENGVLRISPIPEEEVEGTLFYFKSTTEPSDVTETDDLYTDYPQMILFASLAVGERILNKNLEAAKLWEDLAQDQIEKALDYTSKVLGEPTEKISASTAAKILQGQVGK
jgi:hypothetical protein